MYACALVCMWCGCMLLAPEPDAVYADDAGARAPVCTCSELGRFALEGTVLAGWGRVFGLAWWRLNDGGGCEEYLVEGDWYDCCCDCWCVGVYW